MGLVWGRPVTTWLRASYLDDEIVNRVAVEKCPLLSGVSVKIAVKEEPLVLVQIFHQTPHSKARGLLFWIGPVVEPVQVLSQAVQPLVPVKHAIRVQHRNHHENKVFSEVVSSCVLSFVSSGSVIFFINS